MKLSPSSFAMSSTKIQSTKLLLILLIISIISTNPTSADWSHDFDNVTEWTLGGYYLPRSPYDPRANKIDNSSWVVENGKLTTNRPAREDTFDLACINSTITHGTWSLEMSGKVELKVLTGWWNIYALDGYYYMRDDRGYSISINPENNWLTLIFRVEGPETQTNPRVTVPKDKVYEEIDVSGTHQYMLARNDSHIAAYIDNQFVGIAELAFPGVSIDFGTMERVCLVAESGTKAEVDNLTVTEMDANFNIDTSNPYVKKDTNSTPESSDDGKLHFSSYMVGIGAILLNTILRKKFKIKNH